MFIKLFATVPKASKKKIKKKKSPTDNIQFFPFEYVLYAQTLK